MIPRKWENATKSQKIHSFFPGFSRMARQASLLMAARHSRLGPHISALQMSAQANTVPSFSPAPRKADKAYTTRYASRPRPRVR